MGDEMNCPKCGGYLTQLGKCVCGWRMDKRPKIPDNSRKFCVWKNEDGSVCKKWGRLTVEHRWYCREHFEKKLRINNPVVDPEVVRKCLAEMYTSVGKIHKAREVLERGVT